MSFINKADIMNGVSEHYKESLNYFPKDRIVCCALAGSQNYGLATETSDIDTKLIVVPSFAEIAMNNKPVSTTFVRENNEHVDAKDVRLYFDTFLKQNPNFIEILFTDYIIVNPLYKEQWDKLVAMREDIARLNPYAAVCAMMGVAINKRHMMESCGTSEKKSIFDKFGYNPKELCNLLLTHYRLEKYLSGMSYAECLVPSLSGIDYLLDVKRGKYDYNTAIFTADATLNHIDKIGQSYKETHLNIQNEDTVEKLREIQKEIMRISLIQELKPFV